MSLHGIHGPAAAKAASRLLLRRKGVIGFADFTETFATHLGINFNGLYSSGLFCFVGIGGLADRLHAVPHGRPEDFPFAESSVYFLCTLFACGHGVDHGSGTGEKIPAHENGQFRRLAVRKPANPDILL